MEVCTILAQFGTSLYQNWNISVLREETEQRQKREEAEKKRARRTKETPMEFDALEAVRRLTMERDALAEQVKRLEGDALQAPERRERPETGTEPTKDPNGAPRGCMVPSRTCEGCKHSGYAPLLGRVLCQRDSPFPSLEPEGAAIWPIVAKTDCCGEWEARD